MLCGRSTWMHSGILRSAFQMPLHFIGCGDAQRNSWVGGVANGIPRYAFTPVGSNVPATSPLLVTTGSPAMCVIAGCATPHVAIASTISSDLDGSLRIEERRIEWVRIEQR